MSKRTPLADNQNSTEQASATQSRQSILSRRLASGLLIGISVTALVLLAWHFNLFVDLRLGMNNILFVPRTTSDRIVIVAADDASHADYGRSLVNWDRTLHADLLRQLSDAGARVVALDILFAESADDDDALLDAVDYARTATAARTRVVMPVAATHILEADASTPYAVDFSYFLLPNPSVRNEAVALGHTNTQLDADGTLRRQPTRVTAYDDTYFSFAIATYLSDLRVPPAAFDQLVSVDAEHDRLIVSERAIPLDAEGRMLINFFNVPDTGAFPVYSYRDVLNGDVDPAAFADKIVLVGLCNHTGILDTYTVPISIGGRSMTGVEIHANIIEQLLQDDMLHEQSTRSQAATIVGLGLLVSILYAFTIRRWWVFIPSILILLVAWLALAFVVFNTQRTVVHLFYPTLALLLPAPVTLGVRMTYESRRRRRAELLLSSIVTASSQRLSLENTLAGVADDLKTITNANTVTIWLWDAQRRKLNRAYPAADDLTYPLIPNERAFAEMMLKNTGVQRTEKRLAIPLAWQTQPLGVMVAEPARRFGLHTRRVLELFGWQTSSVIANLLQHQETQQLSDLKTRMIRMASHDLKNPLSTVLGYTELMQDHAEIGQPYTDMYARFVDLIHTAGETMLALVDEILNVERTRSGNLTLDTYDMRGLIERLLPTHRAGMEQKKQTLTVEMPDTFPPMYGDPQQVREAINNLLSNAQKYTPEGGAITLRLSQHDKKARIDVQDTGYGISKAAQVKLFQEFYRVRTEQTLDISGTGLGLSLVKSIVDAHRGQVWVESEEGKGSTFTIELPLDADV